MSAEASSKQGKSAAEIIQQINAKNAKLLALALVIGFVMYHGILHLKYGKQAIFIKIFVVFLTSLQ
jgi:hypothetical protein